MTISSKAKIGKNVSIAESAKIFDNVTIEDNVKIGDFCSIGFSNTPNITESLIIKKNVNVNSHSIIYNNSVIGENSVIGHNVLIREKTIIENNVQVGSFSDIEGNTKIEQYVKIHSNVHVGQNSLVMSFSWLFPYVILTNDPIPPSDIRQGVIIEPFSIICTRSTILPGKRIHFGSFVGANSLVNVDLKAETIGSGNPFKQRGSINLIKIPNTKINAYPWINRFKKDYPDNIQQIFKDLRKKFII